MKEIDKNEKTDFFNFEKKGLDFPLYNNNPHLSLGKWIILAIAIIIPMILIFLPIESIGIFKGILYFLIPVLAFGFVVNWKYDLICKKLHKSDIKLIITILILGYIYTIAVSLILFNLNLHIQTNPVIGELNSLIFWLIFPFQIFGEELIKIIPFLIFLFILHKVTGNRKLSILISATISLLIFGLLHLPVYKNIISVLLLQGIGSAFSMFGYLKTKNIFVSFIAHFLFDLISFLVAIGSSS
jgi:CAAX protease family protein